MKKGKTVLTTGEVAKICSVAPRTVSKWFDQGHLKGYRIPGSKDRRIPLEHLIQFMKSNNIPLNGLETGEQRVLVVEQEQSFADRVAETLSKNGDFDVAVAQSAFEAGVMAHANKPHIVIVNVQSTDIDPKAISRTLRTTNGLREVKIVGIGQSLSDHDGESLRQAGFDAFLSKPFEIGALLDIIERPGLELADTEE